MKFTLDYKMVSFSVLFSNFTIFEDSNITHNEIDKVSCIEFCYEQDAELITLGQLKYASKFEVPLSQKKQKQMV